MKWTRDNIVGVEFEHEGDWYRILEVSGEVVRIESRISKFPLTIDYILDALNSDKTIILNTQNQ